MADKIRELPTPPLPSSSKPPSRRGSVGQKARPTTSPSSKPPIFKAKNASNKAGSLRSSSVGSVASAQPIPKQSGTSTIPRSLHRRSVIPTSVESTSGHHRSSSLTENKPDFGRAHGTPNLACLILDLKREKLTQLPVEEALANGCSMTDSGIDDKKEDFDSLPTFDLHPGESKVLAAKLSLQLSTDYSSLKVDYDGGLGSKSDSNFSAQSDSDQQSSRSVRASKSKTSSEVSDSTSLSASCGSKSESPVHNKLSTNVLPTRTPLVKKSLEKKAKKVKFYRNGDKYFKGFVLAVSSERYRLFDTLLEELTRMLRDTVSLPQGVRSIFTTDGVKVTTIEELQDAGSYVCASSDVYKALDYAQCEEPPRIRTNLPSNSKMTRDAMFSGPIRLKSLRENVNSLSSSQNTFTPRLGYRVEEGREFIKPKLITVIRNGVRPRKAVRLLLNKKTAPSFDQVLCDITEAVRPDSGAVRKVFTLDGRQINGLADFFQDADVFIAYGAERFSHDDFDLASEEYKLLPFSRSPMSARKSRRSVLPPKITKEGPSLPRPTNQKPRPRSAYKPKTNEIFEHQRRHSEDDVTPTVNEGFVEQFEDYELPQLIFDKFDLGRVLGDGNFAVVRECTDRITGEVFALKIVDKAKCQGKEVILESEVAVLKRIQHPNIVTLYQEYDLPFQLFLVLELVSGGDLFDAIAGAGRFSEVESASMTKDLASALHYLHDLNIVHRDVKPENLLVVTDSYGRYSLKLADFGLAQEVTELLFTVCGTPTYVAPEILLETGYGLKVDVWALGVILYILLCGFPPFVSATNDQEELFDCILSGHVTFPEPYWDDVGPQPRELIKMMLTLDPARRCSAADVLSHPWILDECDDDSVDLGSHVLQYRKLGVHFDTHDMRPRSQDEEHRLKTDKHNTSITIMAAESTPCLHSLQVL